MYFDQMEDIKVWTWIEIKCWNNEPEDIPEEPEELEEEEPEVAEDGEQPVEGEEEEKTPEDEEATPEEEQTPLDPEQEKIMEFLKQLQIDRAEAAKNPPPAEDTVSEQKKKIQAALGQAMLAKLKKPKAPAPSEGSKGSKGQGS